MQQIKGCRKKNHSGTIGWSRGVPSHAIGLTSKITSRIQTPHQLYHGTF
jgi:hypothetical protein